jgi:hypothetical protein
MAGLPELAGWFVHILAVSDDQDERGEHGR